MQIDLLTGRLWLVPTFKTAAAATAARSLVASVLRGAGLPGVLASDRGTRFASAFRTGLRAALDRAGAPDGPGRGGRFWLHPLH